VIIGNDKRRTGRRTGAADGTRRARPNTDIAEHGLEALSDSMIDEVVILGRRGPRDAAFSVGEFLALGYLDDDVETAMKLRIAR
jgi:ferredoxin/flavodoxin---NADP+ reductase